MAKGQTPSFVVVPGALTQKPFGLVQTLFAGHCTSRTMQTFPIPQLIFYKINHIARIFGICFAKCSLHAFDLSRRTSNQKFHTKFHSPAPESHYTCRWQLAPSKLQCICGVKFIS